MATVALAEMTRERIRELVPQATAVVPVAAIEQHGPHLPIVVDTCICEYVAYKAAEFLAPKFPIAVAPTLPYGNSNHHRPFPGVLSLRSETFVQVLKDLGESLALSGFRRIFFLNGHGGNNEAIGMVTRDLAWNWDVTVGAASYWKLAGESLAKIDSEILSWIPGHAGAFETACIRALRPDLVDEEAIPKTSSASAPRSGPLSPAYVDRYRSMLTINGYTDEPARGDADTGRECLALIVERVADALRQFATLGPGVLG